MLSLFWKQTVSQVVTARKYKASCLEGSWEWSVEMQIIWIGLQSNCNISIVSFCDSVIQRSFIKSVHVLTSYLIALGKTHYIIQIERHFVTELKLKHCCKDFHRSCNMFQLSPCVINFDGSIYCKNDAVILQMKHVVYSIRLDSPFQNACDPSVCVVLHLSAWLKVQHTND
jgi:hypothetical protein